MHLQTNLIIGSFISQKVYSHVTKLTWKGHPAAFSDIVHQFNVTWKDGPPYASFLCEKWGERPVAEWGWQKMFSDNTTVAAEKMLTC